MAGAQPSAHLAVLPYSRSFQELLEKTSRRELEVEDINGDLAGALLVWAIQMSCERSIAACRHPTPRKTNAELSRAIDARPHYLISVT
jgi:hypothetical protein